MNNIIVESLKESAALKEKCIVNIGNQIEDLADKITATYRNEGKVLIFGNGGSAADAQHFAGELMGHFSKDRPPLAAVALTTDSSVLTCISNDYNFDRIYERQLEGLARSGDLALGISTSGNSKNVVNALKKAREMGVYTVGLTGYQGGEMARYSDLLIAVPSRETTRIQEVHITVIHIICEILETGIKEQDS